MPSCRLGKTLETTMLFKLDHVLWGAPDLDAGVRHIAALTGVDPVVGGSHPGMGTRNCLISLGSGVFFEIISPDPAQHDHGPRAAAIAGMPRPGLLTYAVQTDDIGAACAAAEAAGLTVTHRTPMTRTRPDGVTLAWTVAQFSHPDFGPTIPFAIDWQGSPHPSTTTPTGCTLKSLSVLHPHSDRLREIYHSLGLEIVVQAALAPGFCAVLDTPHGEVCLLSV